MKGGADSPDTEKTADSTTFCRKSSGKSPAQLQSQEHRDLKKQSDRQTQACSRC